MSIGYQCVPYSLVFRLTKAHTGEYLAEMTADCHIEYGLTTSVLSIALDNATNNDKMLTELPLLLPESATVGTDYHIRCFGHIINLSVKAFLALFDSSPKALKADDTEDKVPGAEETDPEESDEDDAPDEDAEDFEEDEDAERDAGDWDEIAELSKSLSEVSELEAEDKVVGRTTMKKVCVYHNVCSISDCSFSLGHWRRNSAIVIPSRKHLLNVA